MQTTASTTSTSESLHWNTYTNAALLALVCILLFSFGVLLTSELSPEVSSLLVSGNLVLIGIFMATGFVKRLARLKLPLLLLLGVTGGIVIALLAQDTALLGVGVGIAALVAVITLLVVLQLFDFSRFQLLLSVLALCFSMLGITMVYIAGLQMLTIIWALSAMVCLGMLLHNTISRVLNELPPEAYVDGAAGMFLLSVGLMVNAIILLQAMA